MNFEIHFRAHPRSPVGATYAMILQFKERQDDLVIKARESMNENYKQIEKLYALIES